MDNIFNKIIAILKLQNKQELEFKVTWKRSESEKRG